MICLNSAGNLVRSEVGNQNTKDTDGRKSASSVGLHWGGRAASEGTTSLATSEPCRFAGRQDGRPRAPGTFPPLVDPPPGGGGSRGLHLEPRSALLPTTTTTTTTSEGGEQEEEEEEALRELSGAGTEPPRRRVELCRPSDGRGQRTDPWPQYAFKVSMFNVSCNSH